MLMHGGAKAGIKTRERTQGGAAQTERRKAKPENAVDPGKPSEPHGFGRPEQIQRLCLAYDKLLR
jgi:hypothetical protein